MAQPQQEVSVFLYYSNQCPNSKSKLSKLANMGFAYDQKNFKFVRQRPVQGKVNSIYACCIDNPQINRPQFLTAVPTLFTPSVGKPLLEGDLDNWLDANVNAVAPKKQGNVQNCDITGDGAIQPYFGNEIGGSFSDGYSFISDGADDLKANDMAMPGVHERLNGDIPDIIPVTRHNGDGLFGGGAMSLETQGNNGQAQKKNSGTDKAYEAMMNQRNNEVKMGQGRV
jgi:hypothetical protein